LAIASRSDSAAYIERADLLARVLALRPAGGEEYRRALGALIAADKGTVARIAMQYVRRTVHLELQDLIAEGQMGYCVGVARFDPSFGVQLSTYVSYWIRAYIRKAVRDKDSEIRVPIRSQEKGAEFMRPAKLDDDEGADEVGAAHFLAAPNPDPVDLMTQVWERETLETLMVYLAPREQKILRLRMQGLVLSDVGRRVRLTRERTRQIEVGAIAKLRRLYKNRCPC
jgi:RNA polymerase sigma factor (sigma-70 family)